MISNVLQDDNPIPTTFMFQNTILKSSLFVVNEKDPFYCCFILLSQVALFLIPSFPTALDTFIHCCQLNATLLKLPGTRRGLEPRLLEHYRRIACLKLNESVATQFEKLADSKMALDALCAAYEYILPSMEFLAAQDAPECDIEVAEKIRNRWCSMLGIDLPSTKQEKLQDFLSKLLDPTNDLPKSRPAPAKKRIYNLEKAYREALDLAVKSGEYEAAQVAK